MLNKYHKHSTLGPSKWSPNGASSRVSGYRGERGRMAAASGGRFRAFAERLRSVCGELQQVCSDRVCWFEFEFQFRFAEVPAWWGGQAVLNAAA